MRIGKAWPRARIIATFCPSDYGDAVAVAVAVVVPLGVVLGRGCSMVVVERVFSKVVVGSVLRSICDGCEVIGMVVLGK